MPQRIKLPFFEKRIGHTCGRDLRNKEKNSKMFILAFEFIVQFLSHYEKMKKKLILILKLHAEQDKLQ